MSLIIHTACMRGRGVSSSFLPFFVRPGKVPLFPSFFEGKIQDAENTRNSLLKHRPSFVCSPSPHLNNGPSLPSSSHYTSRPAPCSLSLSICSVHLICCIRNQVLRRGRRRWDREAGSPPPYPCCGLKWRGNKQASKLFSILQAPFATLALGTWHLPSGNSSRPGQIKGSAKRCSPGCVNSTLFDCRAPVG